MFDEALLSAIQGYTAAGVILIIAACLSQCKGMYGMGFQYNAIVFESTTTHLYKTQYLAATLHSFVFS